MFLLIIGSIIGAVIGFCIGAITIPIKIVTGKASTITEVTKILTNPSDTDKI
jgi:hypothetical protein